MSRIFDALQRSEVERSGDASEAASRVTELLQRTESHVASRWGASDAEDDRGAAVKGRRDTLVAVQTESAEAAAARNLDAPVHLPIDRHAEAPARFQTLSVSNPTQGRLVCVPDSESPAVEAFHLLGVRLRHLRRARPLKKVLITSTIPQEGKSMVASNLACTLALRTQQKVLLLEGDVRRPTQSQIFGIDRKPGICEWLHGDRSLQECIYGLEGLGLWILPAGHASSNSLELLQSGRLSAMMDELTAWFDWIIIDSPPVLPLADTSVWTNLSDGILLVARQGITQKRQLQRGLEAIGSQKLIGAILNSSKSISHTDYYYRPSDRLPTDDSSG
jgi:capsular exopolysaccharide synthesis family protein